MSRTITSVKSLLNMMDVVLQQFYMGAGSNDAYAQWSQPMFGCVEVSNFPEGVKCSASRTAVSPG